MVNTTTTTITTIITTTTTTTRGANAVNEAFLGGIFCFCYYYSGYNLAVPIIAHALYDLITIFTTWRSASNDMKKRMTIAIKEGSSDLDKEMGTYTSTQIERAITKAIFDVLDLGIIIIIIIVIIIILSF